MSYCKEFFKGVIDGVKEPFGYSAYLLSNELAYCDGFDKIVSIKKEEIRLKIKDGVIVIDGENLSIEKLEEKSIVVQGAIGGYRIEK